MTYQYAKYQNEFGLTVSISSVHLKEKDHKVRLEQFEQFLALGKLRHFRQAAEQCNLSTSALTRSIQTLEQELDCELVARSTRSVNLTDAGEQFLIYCQDTLTQLKEIKTKLAKHKKNLIDKIIIGYTMDATTIVPLACGKFMQQHPEISIEMHLYTQTQLNEKLKINELDIAIGSSQNHLPENQIVQLPDQLVLFVSKNHPLAFATEIDRTALNPYPMLSCLSSSIQVQKMLQDAAVALHKVSTVKVGNIDQITQTVKDNKHVAIAGIEHTNTIDGNPDLMIIKPTQESQKLALSLTTSRDFNLQHQALQLLSYIADEVKLQTGAQLESIESETF
ncbi:LysR family transcriptional regulator [Pseudoalteromonas tunicata]|uniref:Putative transcriptional regulator, LysR family protein n=1 Tax=Pseudoalteromonas tunicata D2 TaxID=87626 RepID=A4C7B9_9GAMM|nr:LysR family transcriptional regulator [Pseudoalteromonas tunicata]EAR29873.1 putative transcriptional regulator, LysR family protein [Pseudoalteromonas tunicata D2]